MFTIFSNIGYTIRYFERSHCGTMYVASEVIGNAYKLNERQTKLLSTIIESLPRCHFLYMFIGSKLHYSIAEN